MQSGNHLEDFDTVWTKITKVGRATQTGASILMHALFRTNEKPHDTVIQAAENNGGKVATADNFTEVNTAIVKQAK